MRISAPEGRVCILVSVALLVRRPAATSWSVQETGDPQRGHADSIGEYLELWHNGHRYPHPEAA